MIDTQAMIDTYAIQINGSTELVLQGELRDNLNRHGPGGIFTVIAIGPRKLATVQDKVAIIALPDAPKTNTINREAQRKQKKEQKKEAQKNEAY